MSYVNQAQDPRRNAAAIAATFAIHAALGVAVVTGLTIAGIGPLEEERLVGIPLPDPTPPPEPEPEPRPDVSAQNPVAPVPPIPLPTPDATFDEFDASDPVIPATDPFAGTGPIARPDPPRPTPTFTPRKAAPSNDPARWITTADYPASSLRRESEGMAGYRVIVGSNGRVSSCEVTRPSGDRALDEATCRFIERRARFEPATDESGATVVGSYTGSVRWDIPD